MSCATQSPNITLKTPAMVKSYNVYYADSSFKLPNKSIGKKTLTWVQNIMVTPDTRP